MAAAKLEPELGPAHGEAAAGAVGAVILGGPISARSEGGDRRPRQRAQQLEVRAAGRQHGQAVRGQCRHQLALGPGQVRGRVEELEVHGPHRGHDPDPRPGQLGQPRDLARRLHPHLQDQGAVLGLELEDGQWDAGLGVEVAVGLPGRQPGAEGGGGELLGRGLAVAPGHAHHERVHAVQHVACKRVEGLPGVPRADHGHPSTSGSAGGTSPISGEDDRRRSTRLGVRHEAEAVGLGALQGEEEATWNHLPGIGVVGGDLGGAGPPERPAGRLCDLGEAQAHAC